MKRGVHAAFVGCKVSQADAEAALASLLEHGYAAAGEDQAELAVVLTCCVTAEAERKSRRLVRRLAAGGRPVIVAGCAAAYRPEQFAAPGVEVAAFDQVGAVAERLAPAAGGEAAGGGAWAAWPGGVHGRPSVDEPAAAAPGAAAPAATAAAAGRTRLTLKVQDGCSGACSYCAVRLARGPLWSRPLPDALAAARAGLAAGCGELVLSGINLGLYGDGAHGLAELVGALTALPELGRLRLSSLEPHHLNGRLLAALAHPRVARHLHVPLQSADDGVLRAMGRPYTFADYQERLRQARAAMGESMMSTDVIVGFPGEDEAAFERTLAAIAPASGLFGRVHVFPFSARPGTAAAGLRPLPRQVVRGRLKAALEAAAGARAAAAAAEVGGLAEVLVEERVAGLWRGYTSRYTRCYAAGEAAPGRLVRVVVEEPYRDGVRGRVADAAG